MKSIKTLRCITVYFQQLVFPQKVNDIVKKCPVYNHFSVNQSTSCFNSNVVSRGNTVKWFYIIGHVLQKEHHMCHFTFKINNLDQM